jgi:nucleoside-diphosphate-sugar epimerase
MKVFVTGASGWIGSATVQELLGAGHQVVGLARSEESAKRLEKAGAAARRGDLTDLDGLAQAARASEGVVHLAFQHDRALSADFAAGFTAAATADRNAVEAMGVALAGTDRPLVVASGVAALTPGRLATENDGMVPSPRDLSSPMARRRATALFAQSLFGIGVRPVVVRFSPTVHGAGDHGFIATLIKTARQNGTSAYVDEGTHRWPAVHRTDAARLVRLGLENAPPGSVLHAVGEEGVPFRNIATAIGKHLNVPTVSISAQDAPGRLGPIIGRLAGVDGPASSAITRELLGWKPTGPGLVQDLDQGSYFST